MTPQKQSFSVSRIAGILATTALVAAGVAVASPAVAAEIPVQTSNEKLVILNSDGSPGEDISDGGVDLPLGKWIQFSTDWSIDGTVQNGDTFQIQIPEIFKPMDAADFPLKNSDGETLANCSFAQTEPITATCTFQNAPEGGYLNPSGDLFVQLTSDESAERQEITFVVGGNPKVVPDVGIKPPVDGIGGFGKHGTMNIVQQDDGIFKAKGYWELFFIGGGDMTISDTLTSTNPNRPHTFDGWFSLFRYKIIEVRDDGQVKYDAESKETVTNVPAPTVSDDKRTFDVTIPTDAGYWYVYGYNTSADGQSVEGDVFNNQATINDEEVEYTATAQSRAGGSADANTLFSFNISKTVINEDQLSLPDEFEIMVISAAPNEGGYQMTVKPGGEAVSSKYFPAGYPVQICELDPGVEDADWSYTIEGENVSIDAETGCATISPDGGTNVELQLTNTFVEVPPGQPEEPGEPEEPETPEPEEPENNTPDKPGKSQPVGNNESNDQLASTGSEGTSLPFIVGGMLLLAGVTTVAAARRRTRG